MAFLEQQETGYCVPIVSPACGDQRTFFTGTSGEIFGVANEE